MTKLLIGLLGAGVIATGGYAAATSVDADPARTVSLPGATSTGETTTAGTTTVDTTTAATTTNELEDISGPCDEAEHAKRPAVHRRDYARPGTGDDHDDGRRGHLRAVRRGRARERPALHRRDDDGRPWRR